MPDYDLIAGGYNELYGEEQLNKLSIIKKNIKISKKTKILDVGCGTGISSNFGCFIIGIDPSFRLLEYSVLKKSRKFDIIRQAIENNFKISEEIEEEKDRIFICRKP